MTEKRSKRKFYLALVIFALTGQVAWVVENMYFNVFIYKMFHATAGQISLMVEASAVAATLTTVFMGALSDRLQRRRIFMCLGYVAWGVSILAFALVRADLLSAWFGAAAGTGAAAVTAVIILDCIMTFFGSTANDAAYNAWVTDMTGAGDRGAAEGVNSMMPLLAILVVFGGFMGFDLNRAESWTAIYLIIGGLVLAVGLAGFFLVEEAKADRPDDLGYLGTILYGFRPRVIREHPGLYVTLGEFMLFGTAIQVFMPYLLIYYEQSLGMADYVLILAPAILLAAVVTALYGRLVDRFGFRRTVFPSLGMLAAGFVLLILFPGVIPAVGWGMKVPVFLGSLLMMCGYLTGMAVFGTRIRNLTPEHMAGRFQGLRILAQVLVPGVVGPAVGAAVLRDAAVIVNGDGTTSFLPDHRIFAAALAVTAALLALLCLVREKKREAEG